MVFHCLKMSVHKLKDCHFQIYHLAVVDKRLLKRRVGQIILSVSLLRRSQEISTACTAELSES